MLLYKNRVMNGHTSLRVYGDEVHGLIMINLYTSNTKHQGIPISYIVQEKGEKNE